MWFHLLFAIRMTFPDNNWPLLQNKGFSKRQRTWYQCVRGSVGAVLNQTCCVDPINATSNQNASP